MTTPPPFNLLSQSETRANCQPWNWYTLEDFIEHGFDEDPAAAQDWFDADVSPEQARLYITMGMTPQDAWGWCMVPEAVQSFLHAGFERGEAWEWASEDIFGYEAMFWRESGFTPEQARVLRTATKPVAQSVLWTLTGLSFRDALEHAEKGANPAEFLTPPELEGAAPVLPSEGDDHDDHVDLRN
ncbi:hypothetical protein [Knoellia sp. LjRoot47]|uniref:hypothetical protein n=1 Tax=Knoellia sp. LjRoot47 TaxID=3342330 RepID=UPI003ECD9181